MNQYGCLGNAQERQGLHALRQDLGSAQDWMARICGPHELKAATPQRLRFEHEGNVMGGLATVLGRIEYGTDVTIDIEPCALNSYSISLPLEGQQALQTASGCLLSDSASGLIVSPQKRQALAIDGNCRKIQVAIKARAMAAVLEDMLLQPLHEPLLFAPQISATRKKGEHPGAAGTGDAHLLSGGVRGRPQQNSFKPEPGSHQTSPPPPCPRRRRRPTAPRW